MTPSAPGIGVALIVAGLVAGFPDDRVAAPAAASGVGLPIMK